MLPAVEVGVDVVVLVVEVGGRIGDDETMPSTANSAPALVVRRTRESRLLLLVVVLPVVREVVVGSLPRGVPAVTAVTARSIIFTTSVVVVVVVVVVVPWVMVLDLAVLCLDSSLHYNGLGGHETK
jgi:hypothetical protein